jgi:hypothetical protein
MKSRKVKRGPLSVLVLVGGGGHKERGKEGKYGGNTIYS